MNSNRASGIYIDVSLGGCKKMLIMLCFIILPRPPGWIKVQRRIPRGYNENPQQGNIFLNYFTAYGLCADIEKIMSIVDLFEYTISSMNNASSPLSTSGYNKVTRNYFPIT